MTVALTDAGRKQSAPQEKNDCSVRAMALAFEITYGEASDYAKKHGRKPESGWAMFAHFYLISQNDIQVFGKKLKWIDFYPKEALKPTAKKFCDTFNEGRYIVHIGGHAVAVINGVVHDDSDSHVDPFDKVLRAIKILS